MTQPETTPYPAVVKEFQKFLVDTHFQVVGESTGGHGDCALEYRNDECQVQILGDWRRWWITFKVEPLTEWFDVDVWRSYLDNTPVNLEISSIEEDVKFSRERWREVADSSNTAGLE